MKQLYLNIKDILCDISSDKYLHFIVCMILTQALWNLTMDIILTLIVMLGIGILKEVFDKFIMKEKFDYKDLEADTYGILTGIILLIL